MKKCTLVNWEEAFRLAKNVYQKIRNSEFFPDVVVAIARGGWFHARVLCDIMGIKELYSMNIRHWGVAEVSPEAKLTHPLQVDLSGKKVLLVDDVTDTGDSMKIAYEHLKKLKAKEVRTATLHHKLSSSFQPDYYGEKMEEWRWIVYPWGLYEDLTHFILEILEHPMSAEEIEKCLRNKYELDVSLKEILENMKSSRLIEEENRIYKKIKNEK
jgi:hypothetical protein